MRSAPPRGRMARPAPPARAPGPGPGGETSAGAPTGGVATAGAPTGGVAPPGPRPLSPPAGAPPAPPRAPSAAPTPPATLRGPITGIGFGDLITLPTGEQVIDPNNVAIVKNVPVQTGPTTTAQGGPAVNALIGEGFPTHTDPKTGNVFVKYPPNLIHGNVTG